MNLRGWILGVVISAAAAPAFSTGVRIELPEVIEVTGGHVRLGQIANLSTTNLQLLKRLMALPLGPAPAVGETVSLDRQTLDRWMRLRAGLSTSDIDWTGASRTSVTRSSQQVPRSAVINAASGALKSWLSSHSDRSELKLVTDIRLIEIPKGTLRLSVRPINQNIPTRRMQLWVDLWSGHELTRSVPVAFDVKAYAPALVATEHIPARSAIRGATMLKEIDVTERGYSSGQRVESLDEISESAVATRHLRTGQMILASDSKTDPAVRRGEWAGARLMVGDLALENRVEVLHDAHVGQSVRVRVGPTGQATHAMVIGRGQVEFTP